MNDISQQDLVPADRGFGGGKENDESVPMDLGEDFEINVGVGVIDDADILVIDPAADEELVAPSPTPAVYSWGRSDLGCLFTRKNNEKAVSETSSQQYHQPQPQQHNDTIMAAEGVHYFQRPGQTIISIASSAYHTAAVTATGEIYTCGQNDQGQVCGDGEGEGIMEVHRPRLVETLQNQSVTAVACGLSHTVCLTASGCAISFGGNDCGQLGHSAEKHSHVPARTVTFATESPLNGPNSVPQAIRARVILKRVACGDLFSLFLSTVGEVYGCGSATFLGNPLIRDPRTKSTRQLVYQAERVQSLVGVNIRDIAAGSAHSLALASHGLALYTWGSNRHGQLGVDSNMRTERAQGGEEMHEQTPVQVPLPNMIVNNGEQELLLGCSAGTAHSLLWTSAGQLLGAGCNKYGQLGLPGLPRVNEFQLISLSSSTASAFSLSSETTNNSGNGAERVTMACCGANHSVILVHGQVTVSSNESSDQTPQVSNALSLALPLSASPSLLTIPPHTPAISSLVLSSSLLFPLSTSLSLSTQNMVQGSGALAAMPSLSFSPVVAAGTDAGVNMDQQQSTIPKIRTYTRVLAFGSNTFNQCAPQSTASMLRSPEQVQISLTDTSTSSSALNASSSSVSSNVPRAPTVLYIAAGGDQSFAIAVSPTSVHPDAGNLLTSLLSRTMSLSQQIPFGRTLSLSTMHNHQSGNNRSGGSLAGSLLKRQFSTLASKAVLPMSTRAMLSLLKEFEGSTAVANDKQDKGLTAVINTVCEIFSSPSLLSASFNSLTSSQNTVCYDVEGLEKFYVDLFSLPTEEGKSIVTTRLFAALQQCVAELERARMMSPTMTLSATALPAVVRVVLMVWQCPLMGNASLSADLMLRLLRLILSSTVGVNTTNQQEVLMEALNVNFYSANTNTNSSGTLCSILRSRLLKSLIEHLDFFLQPVAGSTPASPVMVDLQVLRVLCQGVNWIHVVNKDHVTKLASLKVIEGVGSSSTTTSIGSSMNAIGTALEPHQFYSHRVSCLHESMLLKDLMQWRQFNAQSNNPQAANTNGNANSPVNPFFISAYSFLLTPEAKRRLMLTEAQFHQRMAQNQAFAHGLMSGSPAMIMPYFLLPIERDHILQQTLIHLTSASPLDLKKPLKVIFLGEEGIDEGGVRKEFFQILMTQRLLALDYAMFLPSPDQRSMWLNQANCWSNDEYALIGCLLGLAVYNGVLLDVHFPKVFYKKLLLQAQQMDASMSLGASSSNSKSSSNVSQQQPQEQQQQSQSSQQNQKQQAKSSFTLADLRSLDPELAQGLHQLLTYSPASDVEHIFCRTFTVEWEEFGERRCHELIPNGKDTAVTGENRVDFVQRLLQWILVESISSQFNSLFAGFSRVVHPSQLVLFTAEELELLMTGTPHLDFKELEANTEYIGSGKEGEEEWNAQHPVIRWFWETVHGMSLDDKQAFLQFVTGSKKAPIGGLKNLGLKIQRMGPDTASLPTAHTCFNVLLLPQYSSAEKLKDRLLKAIQECEGFGLK